MSSAQRHGGLRVAVVDYGAGNLVSIEQALTFVGAEVRVATGPDDLVDAEAVVVPGVGAAATGDGAAATRRVSSIRISRWIGAGRPYLGHLPRAPAPVRRQRRGRRVDARRPPGATRSSSRTRRPCRTSAGTRSYAGAITPCSTGIAQAADLYFVHSYAGRPEGAGADTVTLAETEHGSRFVSAVDRGNVLGVQFHPERSGGTGLRILGNFIRWATALAAGAGAERSPVGAGGTAGGD